MHIRLDLKRERVVYYELNCIRERDRAWQRGRERGVDLTSRDVEPSRRYISRDEEGRLSAFKRFEGPGARLLREIAVDRSASPTATRKGSLERTREAQKKRCLPCSTTRRNTPPVPAHGPPPSCTARTPTRGSCERRALLRGVPAEPGLSPRVPSPRRSE